MSTVDNLRLQYRVLMEDLDQLSNRLCESSDKDFRSDLITKMQFVQSQMKTLSDAIFTLQGIRYEA